MQLFSSNVHRIYRECLFRIQNENLQMCHVLKSVIKSEFSVSKLSIEKAPQPEQTLEKMSF